MYPPGPPGGSASPPGPTGGSMYPPGPPGGSAYPPGLPDAPSSPPYQGIHIVMVDKLISHSIMIFEAFISKADNRF